MSPVCIRLTSQSLGRFPPECGRDGEPARWFVQEMLWALWLEVADTLLGGGSLPTEVVVRVGRANIPLPVSGDDWTTFQAELNCVHTDVRDQVSRLLAAQLMGIRTGPSGRVEPLSAELASLVILLCDLDQRERSHREENFHVDVNPSDVVGRHPTPAAFGPADLLPSATLLVDYAGLKRSSRGHGPLRSAYFSVYRPLRRRLEGRKWLPPIVPPPELSLDFLRQALRDGRLMSELPNLHPDSSILLPPVISTDRIASDNQIGLAALAAILAPVLQEHRDPLQTARTATAELGQSLCAAVANLLQVGNIEWYGRPGDRVTIRLPQPEWRLEEHAAVPSDPASPRVYYVTRWGLRLYGRIVSPALIAPDLEAHQ